MCKRVGKGPQVFEVRVGHEHQVDLGRNAANELPVQAEGLLLRLQCAAVRREGREGRTERAVSAFADQSHRSSLARQRGTGGVLVYVRVCRAWRPKRARTAVEKDFVLVHLKQGAQWFLCMCPVQRRELNNGRHGTGVIALRRA